MNSYLRTFMFTALIAGALAWTGCGETDGTGAGGTGGTGGDAGVELVELVRFKVSDLAGDEEASISSETSPELFVLEARIESAEITYVNPASQSKDNEGPATFLGVLTPIDPAETAGYIQLMVTPVASEAITAEQTTYTTSAKFPDNPSSLQLRSSKDDFASVLSTIPTDQERTETTAVTTNADDAPFSFRWVAGNDFGEFGGGAAGFTTNDVILEGLPPQ